MKKKEKYLLVSCLLIIMINVFWLFTYNKPDESVITAFISLKNFIFESVTSIGRVLIMIEGLVSEVNITSPENKTYNFSVGDPYILDLNVSANFDADTWWYTLIDLKHNIIINDSDIFASGVNSVNTTFSAVRWSNKLIVYANNSGGNIFNGSVIFFVYVPNSAPIIEYIAPEIYVCENKPITYYFNVTDVDEDDNGALEPDIVPSDPFFIYPLTYTLSSGENRTQFQITSIELSKGHATSDGNGWKVYEETVSVKDNYNATCCSDSDQTNITVIEINNAPDITSMDNQAVYTLGANTTFYHQLQVTDTEDGNQDSGNLTFNLTILNSTGDYVNLFNISQNGIMNYTVNETHIGVYNISVCVTDTTEIDNPHEKIIEECGQDGSTITSCQNFSLTVTDENRAPTITNWYPLNLSLNVSGTDSLYFNITKYDADGTVPVAFWYVDNVFQKSDSGSLVDEFTYSFGYRVSGEHTIKVEITDGLLNDSIQWNLTVEYVELPPEAPPAEGVGGVGIRVCVEEWICYDWGICQNAEKSLEAGILSGEYYRAIKNNCSKNKWYEEFCGFQIRNCLDFNNCNTTYKKPEEIQSCYYTEEPSCYDGIENCHDGACEFLVDCGGPCPPCPTCSDGIQNQGEKGIDCGGPCPWPCLEKPKPLAKKPLMYIFIIILIILLLIIIIEFKRIIEFRKKLKKVRK